ncbi:MAG: glyoxalase/bleomycin resistance/dioxygenase family protein [Sandaracinus sp.]|nr:glyoxalase/bleomycin resistance/dioxygenase family protein [Sandaracinus sp.]|tara:strand:- start:1164 stop:1613 length:450 start_codon:yes stop_codon:yes gene_type:complete
MTRIHVSLAARDIAASRRFYETLFGQPPVKDLPGYVKFSVADPSVNLSLVQSDRPGAPGPVRHYGIEVDSTEAVVGAHGRIRAAGFATMDETGTTCCFAVQDKVWAVDPDGNRWEIFVVLADAEEMGDAPPPMPGETADPTDAGSPCCG